MHDDYTDIVMRAGEPSYYDQRGVPRYRDFSPSVEGKLYMREIILAEVACQECLRAFKVSAFSSVWPGHEKKEPFLSELIRQGVPFLYGDPPAHRDDQENVEIKCCTGDSMNSIAVRIFEFWTRKDPDAQVIKAEWVRDPSLEGDLKSADEDDLRYHRYKWYVQDRRGDLAARHPA